MVTDFPIQGILDHLVRRIVDIMPITAAGVTLIAPGLEPRYIAASDASALRYEKLQTELGEGPCLAAYRRPARRSRCPTCAPRSASRSSRRGRWSRAGGGVHVSVAPRGSCSSARLTCTGTRRGRCRAASMIAAQTLADVAAAYLINAQARSDLQDSSDQSREAALHDPLTGLPNRVLMLRAARARVSGEPALGEDLGGVLHRSRPLQAGQRHLRPPGRR